MKAAYETSKASEEITPQWWLAYGAGGLMALIPLLLMVLGHWHSA